MALKKCRECGHEVSGEAKTCPKCGISSPAGKTSIFKMVLYGLAGLFVLSLIGSLTGGSSKSSSASSASIAAESMAADAPPPPPKTKPQEQPPRAVKAVDLWNAYQENEVAADAAYKGKRLLVTGTVASIDKNVFGGIYVALKSPNEFMNTQANLDDGEESAAAALRKGQSVKLLCTGGTMIVGSPVLDHCSIE